MWWIPERIYNPIALTPHKHFDMTNVSEKALIREYTAEQCEEYKNDWLTMDKLSRSILQDLTDLVNKQYQQLTGHPLF